jgi:hypothetical protein
MNKRIAVVALAAMSLVATGCKDFLTETPKDFVGPDNFYRNASDAVAAVNSAYASFVLLPGTLNNVATNMSSDDYYGRNFYLLTELPTEAMTNRLGATNERELIDNYSGVTSGHVYFANLWRAAYFAINKANAVTDHVPGIDMDAALRSRVVGEAEFLRALHYFNLVRFFGGVPLKVHETAGLDSLQLPRAAATATYDQIIADLKDAAVSLPTTYASKDYGRATKGAALTQLGKVYLQRGATGIGTATDFATAADYFRQVVQLGVYRLDANFGSLFDGTNEQSPEIIFAVQNAPIAGAGGQLGKYMMPSKPIGGNSGQNAFQIEFPFLNSWADTDKRKAGSLLLSWVDKSGKTIPWLATSAGVSAYGSTGPVPRKFIDVTSQGSGLDACDYVVLRYADVLLSLAEAVNRASGPTAEAYDAVNQVRARAGVPALTPGLAQAAFQDSVFLERRYEFFAEGQGLFDSQRNWDWAKTRIQANIHQAPTLNKSPLTSSVPKWPNSAGPEPQVTDAFKLWPIPDRAKQLDPQLAGQQNPGW